MFTNRPFFVPIAPEQSPRVTCGLTCRSGGDLRLRSFLRSHGSLRPEPRVTSSPKVCPGEQRSRPKTEHSRAPYTDRLLFVESPARANPHEFQRLMLAGDLRSPGSPKFVTTIEWRPVRWCLRTALCLDGEGEEQRIEQRKRRCSSRGRRALCGERAMLGFSWGPRVRCTRIRRGPRRSGAHSSSASAAPGGNRRCPSKTVSTRMLSSRTRYTIR